jgi:hypothetical protein
MELPMKSIFAFLITMFASQVFAADAPKAETKKAAPKAEAKKAAPKAEAKKDVPAVEVKK